MGWTSGIKRNVLLLGLVSLLTDMSSEIILPILPMFIVSLGGAGLAVGLIGGLGDSCASIVNLFSGHLSDKLGKRKPFVYLGYAISAFMKLLFTLSKTWGHLLVFRILERGGKGIRTAPRDAIIADSAQEERGKAFGLHRALDTSGAVFGSIIAFILFWFLGLGFRAILLIAALIAFLSISPLFFVEETEGKPRTETLKVSLNGLPGELRFFIVVASVFALANFTYMFFILKAQQSFSGKEAVGFPILLYVLFNTVYALLSVPSGILSDRIGRERVLILGYSTFGVMCLGFAYLSAFSGLIILFILMGVVFALVDGNQRAFVSDLAEGDMKGTALGTFHAAISLATLLASLIAGFLWEYVGAGATFIYGSGMAFLAALLFVVHRP
ncbi:MAG: MFS transporter [Candidatus Hydrothermarchaeales archaeon]